ncbi:hypothetical protein ACOME3_007689 [Neoechinorhynchus agilis]
MNNRNQYNTKQSPPAKKYLFRSGERRSIQVGDVIFKGEYIHKKFEDEQKKYIVPCSKMYAKNERVKIITRMLDGIEQRRPAKKVEDEAIDGMDDCNKKTSVVQSNSAVVRFSNTRFEWTQGLNSNMKMKDCARTPQSNLVLKTFDLSENNPFNTNKSNNDVNEETMQEECSEPVDECSSEEDCDSGSDELQVRQFCQICGKRYRNGEEYDVQYCPFCGTFVGL